MNMIKKYFLLLLLLPLLSVSCKKEPSAPDNPVSGNNPAKAVYVLNEGLFNMNNSSLTFFNLTDSTAQTDYFIAKNGRKLGDTGNDIAIYGSKMYIVVNVSSQLEVVDAASGVSIKRIPFFNGDTPRQPRYIAFDKNKAYVCSFDGTVAVVDTATLEIENYITAGNNPDGIAITNGKIYVSNSGGLDAPDYDSTVSVIDIATQSEVKKITVRINPYRIVADDYGDLYVISRGNYGKIKMCLQVIDSKTDQLKYTFSDLEALNLAINGDTAYVYYYDYITGSGSKIMLIDVKNEKLIGNQFISDGTEIETVYGIAVDKYSGDVFISDAHGFINTGEVYCFDKQGKKKYSFRAGLNPGQIAIWK